MRPIYLTMAAVAGLSVAAPAPAQWAHEPTYSQASTTLESEQWGHSRTYSAQLRMQIDAAVNQGTISRRESIALRHELSRLVRLERKFGPDGISGPEHAQLLQQSTALAKEISIASRNHYGHHGNTASWESGRINGQWVPDARFAGLHAGDRFNGDVRIGQHATSRMVNLPAEYRSQYVDDARIYYGYDNGRVYQIDRQSKMILALLDIAR
jgi:hypothetical protein